MKSFIYCLLFIISVSLATVCSAQIPTDSLALWFKADAGTYTDIFCSTEATTADDAVFCWKDQSNNALDAARQESAQPVYQTDALNGLPTVRFDGTGGLGTLESEQLSFVDMTVFVVASTPDPREAHFSLASSDAPERFFVGKWSGDALENPTSPGIAYFKPSSSNFWRGLDHQTDATIFDFVLVSATFGEAGTALDVNVLGIPSTESIFCSKIGLIRPCPGAPARNSRAGFIGQRENAATNPLTGDVAEIIVYGGIVMDGVRRAIIENYLSAKYGLTINPPADFYAGDLEANGHYDFDVSGIGASADTSLTAGYSAGLIIEEANGSLTSGAYLLAGHRTAVSGASGDGIPNGVNGRTNRVWYVDKTGSLDANLAFDFSQGSPAPAGNAYVLLYSSSATEEFSILTSTATVSSDQVAFTLSDAELTNGYYALGTSDANSSPLPELPQSVVPPPPSSPIANEDYEIPQGFSLSAIYPNPFNPAAAFDLTLSAPQEVRISVFDVTGREVAVLQNGWLNAQTHSFTLEGHHLPSGLLMVQVTGETFRSTRKAVLLK